VKKVINKSPAMGCLSEKERPIHWRLTREKLVGTTCAQAGTFQKRGRGSRYKKVPKAQVPYTPSKENRVEVKHGTKYLKKDAVGPFG